MIFNYQKGTIRLKESSENTHMLQVGDNRYIFNNDELRVFKMLIEENCDAVDKSKVIKNRYLRKVKDFYLDRNRKIIALEGNGNDVFDMREKGTVNWVVKRFIETIKDRKGEEMKDKYINEITLLDNEVFIKSSIAPTNYISTIEIMDDSATGGTTLTREELSRLINLIRSNCSSISEVDLNNENYNVIENLLVVKTSKGLNVKGVRVNGKAYICKDIAKTFRKSLKAISGSRVPVSCNNFDPRFGNPSYLGDNIPRSYYNEPYTDPNYHQSVQQRYLDPRFQPHRPAMSQPVTGPAFQQPYQPAGLYSQPQNPLRQPMSPVNTYYIVMGDLEITLKPDSRVANYLVVTKIKKGNEINVEGKTAPSKFLTIFEKYVNDLRKEEKEIDALANFINTILPKEEKVELLVSTGETLNAAIQFEDNKNIKTIKIKSRGIETVVYTRPVELTVFKINSFTNKEKILEKLNELVGNHNEKIENSKEF